MTNYPQNRLTIQNRNRELANQRNSGVKSGLKVYGNAGLLFWREWAKTERDVKPAKQLYLSQFEVPL